MITILISFFQEAQAAMAAFNLGVKSQCGMAEPMLLKNRLAMEVTRQVQALVHQLPRQPKTTSVMRLILLREIDQLNTARTMSLPVKLSLLMIWMITSYHSIINLMRQREAASSRAHPPAARRRRAARWQSDAG